MTACARRRPSEVLKHEHQVILKVLDVLETLVERSKDQGFKHKPLLSCVEFFELFADACHHAKEENQYFPILESRGVPREGGPIGVMLYEHRVARSLIQHMREALGESGSDVDSIDETEFRNAATSYLDLMRQHIAKENNILFEIGDQVMTEEDQLALGESFCTVACQSFGGKRTEELEAIAGELEARWSPAA